MSYRHDAEVAVKKRVKECFPNAKEKAIANSYWAYDKAQNILLFANLKDKPLVLTKIRLKYVSSHEYIKRKSMTFKFYGENQVDKTVYCDRVWHYRRYIMKAVNDNLVAHEIVKNK